MIISDQKPGDEMAEMKRTPDPHQSVARLTRGDSGFTMIELMVVTAIVAILAVVAFGSLQSQLPRARTNSAARQLKADLQKAKLEAIKRNTPCLVQFTVAAGNNSGSCNTCIDSNGDNVCTAANDTMITTLDLNDFDGAAVTNADFSGNLVFVFNPRGIPEQTNGAMCSGTAVIDCTVDANYSRSVVMSRVGRLRIE